LHIALKHRLAQKERPVMDVLCVGHAAWDISLFVEGFPLENSKCEVRTMLESGGGPAANAAYLLSRWGVSCGIASQIGEDAYGHRMVEEFLAVGTDIAALDRLADYPTPVSVILVNEHDGSRTIVNRKVLTREMPLKKDALAGARPRVLLFDGHALEASLEAMALFPQAKTILDAGSLREGTRELAKRVDYLVCSERFARQLSELPDLESSQNQARAMAILYRHNGKPVVVTRGEREILYGTDENIERMPTFPVRALDTTAAGDISMSLVISRRSRLSRGRNINRCDPSITGCR
jgi:sugar/nucleoside kinase (ribokinase family)